MLSKFELENGYRQEVRYILDKTLRMLNTDHINVNELKNNIKHLMILESDLKCLYDELVMKLDKEQFDDWLKNKDSVDFSNEYIDY